MPDTPALTQTPNPIEALRAGVERHAAVINAAKQTGQEVRGASTQPPGPASVPR